MKQQEPTPPPEPPPQRESPSLSCFIRFVFHPLAVPTLYYIDATPMTLSVAQIHAARTSVHSSLVCSFNFECGARENRSRWLIHLQYTHTHTQHKHIPEARAPANCTHHFVYSHTLAMSSSFQHFLGLQNSLTKRENLKISMSKSHYIHICILGSESV